MRLNERGIGNLAFIAVLVLLVVAIAMFFVANSDADAAKQKMAKARADATQAQTDRIEGENAYDALLEITGLTLPELVRGGGGFPEPDKIRESSRKWIMDQVKAATAESEITLSTKNYQVPAGGNKIEEVEGDKVRLRLFSVNQGQETITMASVFAELPASFKYAGEIAVENNDKFETTATSMRQQVDGHVKANEAARSQYNTDVSAKTSEKESVQQELSSTRDSLQAQTAKLDSMESELANTKSEAAREVRKMTRERDAWKSRAMNEKKKIEIQVQEDPKDGEVLEASRTRGTVWINLGRRNKVTRGTKFTVWHFGKGNAREDVAVIRVLSVDQSRSEANIIKRMDRRVSVTKGMNISNPFYDPHRDLKVYLYGDLRRYTTSTAQRRLASAGCQISSVLDDTVNVIVLGEPPIAGGALDDEEDAAAAERKRSIERDKRLMEIMDRAAAIGAVVVTEEVLSTFIDY